MITIFATESQALAGPIYCAAKFARGDTVQLNGLIFSVECETETPSDAHGTLRIVTVARRREKYTVATPVFVA